MAQDYIVTLKDYSTVTISGVETVEKDGAGLRLRDADGNIVASFDDGQSRSCWPASSTTASAPIPEEGPEG